MRVLQVEKLRSRLVYVLILLRERPRVVCFNVVARFAFAKAREMLFECSIAFVRAVVVLFGEHFLALVGMQIFMGVYCWG